MGSDPWFLYTWFFSPLHHYVAKSYTSFS
jgi:hypothetical protein